ncbi:MULTISPECIES: hypothetical protein [Francisella]|uniref:Uncharacterized protein n=1 Tax=Francisella opportunistica TaxID=2016517 RepID=A0A345JSI6_9GAMM|nr:MULTISPECIES: hypothetical protein [Francisella]APC92052.1 hypothetical protein BBG19_1322 [Francisella sp. MA067296]AXH30282.1 hypothetical protein CGC43_06645 [Francisella opportunistica]AXH31923.1 hypothetical protein CGC44_06625 [Francisella opportunistica]AXH33569.1 hypothetical protein CGC45_06640 [Francisella opportunistica]
MSARQLLENLSSLISQLEKCVEEYISYNEKAKQSIFHFHHRHRQSGLDRANYLLNFLRDLNQKVNASQDSDARLPTYENQLIQELQSFVSKTGRYRDFTGLIKVHPNSCLTYIIHALYTSFGLVKTDILKDFLHTILHNNNKLHDTTREHDRNEIKRKIWNYPTIINRASSIASEASIVSRSSELSDTKRGVQAKETWEIYRNNKKCAVSCQHAALLWALEGTNVEVSKKSISKAMHEGDRWKPPAGNLNYKKNPTEAYQKYFGVDLVETGIAPQGEISVFQFMQNQKSGTAFLIRSNVDHELGHISYIEKDTNGIVRQSTWGPSRSLSLPNRIETFMMGLKQNQFGDFIVYKYHQLR